MSCVWWSKHSGISGSVPVQIMEALRGQGKCNSCGGLIRGLVYILSYSVGAYTILETPSSLPQYLVVLRDLKAMEESSKEFQQTLKSYTEGVRTQPGSVQYVRVNRVALPI